MQNYRMRHPNGLRFEVPVGVVYEASQGRAERGGWNPGLGANLCARLAI